MPAFALYAPETEMYYCDEPYVVLHVRNRGAGPDGRDTWEDVPLVWGCAVDRADWATRYATHARARLAQAEAGKAYSEIIPL